MAEGARFELADHEVVAGFQDRCLKPLGHPSLRQMNRLSPAAASVKSLMLPFMQRFFNPSCDRISCHLPGHAVLDNSLIVSPIKRLTVWPVAEYPARDAPL